MNILKTVGKKRRPINLFFAELIIALLFFSISGAVILKVFASADGKSKRNSEKENAMIRARSIAEVYSETGSAAETFDTVFPANGEFDENGDYSVRLDGYCRPSTDGKIVMTAAEEREKTVSGTMSHLTVSFSAESGELYALVCSAYKPDGGDFDA